jgi:acetylornithine/succinyldiaminopimelate/putrescine aminotransferase
LTKLLINSWDDWIDFTSGGIFQAPFGAQDEGVRRVLADQPMVACYGAHYDNPAALRLVAMLKEFTGYESVALFSTGSEATEAFWRVCRVYTGKPGIWGGLVNPDEVGNTDPSPLPDAMHGMTLGALVMAGKMRLPDPGMFMQLGGDFEGRAYDSTGCAIFEPYHAPSAQFHVEQPTMDRIRSNMAMFPDIHFCCDEIQGGMGRTGKLFAHQWYSPVVKSEFVTIGKMLGGGLPLSALLGPKEIMEDPLTLEHAHLHSTHSGHPVMCAVGCHVIERIQKEGLIDESYRKGLLMAEALKGIGVRVHAGRGLLAGLEMEGPLQASKVVLKCQKRGLLVVDTGRRWVKLGPALVIEDDELINGCMILKEVIKEVQSESEAQRNISEESGESSSDLQKVGL